MRSREGINPGNVIPAVNPDKKRAKFPSINANTRKNLRYIFTLLAAVGVHLGMNEARNSAADMPNVQACIRAGDTLDYASTSPPTNRIDLEDWGNKQ